MKKLALILLTACTFQTKDPNKAEVMVKSQAPDATCVDFPAKNGIDLAVCNIPSSPNKGDAYVSVYATGRPWQVFLLKDPKAPAQATPTPPPPAPPPPAPDAGTGSGSDAPGAGSGSHSK